MSRSHVQRAILILSIALLIYPFANALFGEDASSAGAVHNPDFDGNGVVDFDDFSLLARVFGMRRGDAGYGDRFDLNRDGVIGFRDFLIFIRYFGQVAPVPVAAIPALQAHVGGDSLRVDVAEYFHDGDGDALRYTASSDDEAIASVRVSEAWVAIAPVGAGSATITVTATDVAGLCATQTIAVTVTLFARTPLMRELDENARAGEPVGDPVAVPGLRGLAYSLTGADADSFDIDARTGQIRTRQGITYDYERDETFSLAVVATDGDNADSIAVTISVEDVDEPPSLPPSNFHVIPDNQSLSVHFHAVRDEPGKPPVLGYHAEIRTGEEGDWINRKIIYGRTNNTVYYTDLGQVPRYQDPSLQNGQLYQVRVRTWNAEGESDWAEPVSGVPVYTPPPPVAHVTAPAPFEQDNRARVDLSDVTGQGGSITLAKNALADNAIQSAFAEILAVSNFPAIPSQAGFAVSESGSIFDITLKARLASGEEVNIGGDLRVPVEICLPVPDGIDNPVIIHYKDAWEMLETQRLDDNAICAHAATFSFYGVGVALNDRPEFDILTPPLTIPENTAAGQNIGNPVTATDSDGGTLVYSLEGEDAASFDIDAATGQIKTKAGVTYNYEAKNTYAVTVKVIDGQGGSATIPVTITLTDVDGEAPSRPAAPSVSAASSASLTATWATPANPGPPITDYDVQYRVGNSGGFTDWPHSGTGLTATITGLTATTSYEVQVRAKNAEGTGAWSNSGAGTTSNLPSLSINSPSVAEGNSGSATLRFTVTLSPASGQPVTVAYEDDGTGTATSGTDYTAITAGTLTFAANETNKTLDVSVTGDTVDEPNETVIVALSNPTNATIATGTGTGTIADDDDKPKVTLVLNPTAINENSGITTVTATLNRASSQATTITVSAMASTNAVTGDFTLSAATKLTIATGQTTSTGAVTITANDNNQDDPNKEVTVSATANNGQGVTAPDDVTLTINDDDATPTVTLVLNPTAINENSGITTVTAKLNRASSQATTITVSADPGANAVVADFTLSANTKLTIATGQTTSTGAVTITANDNNQDDPNKLVTVSATADNGQGVTAPDAVTLMINDDDGAPALSINSLSVTEGNSGSVTLRFTVMLSPASGQQVTVAYSDTLTGTATSGTDYTAITDGTLTFAASETNKTFDVSVTGDTIDEPNETVIVKLRNPTNATIATGTGTGTITDDDDTPKVTLVLSPSTIDESGTTNATTVTATLNGASSQATTITVSAAPGANAVAADFTLSAATKLTIATGQTTSTGAVTITAVNNNQDDPNKEVTVSATADNGHGVTAPDAVTLTINDDDATPTATLVLSPSTIDEGGTTNVTTITAKLNRASSQATTITVSATASTNAVSGDFTLSANTKLTIATGQTTSTGAVTITAVNNNQDDPNKEVTVSATAENGQGVTAPGDVTLTINDDDATPTVTLVLNPTAIDENSGVTTITATLNGASSQATTITVSAAPGTNAVSGDFTLSANTKLTIATGQTTSTGTVTITAVNNNEDEPNKSVTVSATAGNGHSITAPGDVTLTINDDDDTPKVTLVLSPSTIDESGTTNATTITATLNLASSQATTITVSAAPGTNTVSGDYTLSANTKLTIATSQTTSTGAVTITAVNNYISAPNKSVTVSATAQNGQGITAPDDVTLTIRNDDVVTAGICDRTQAVQDTILAALTNRTLCHEVTNSDLSGIMGTLDFRYSSIATLKANDFSGLDSLGTLRIDRNNLTTLPAALFSSLTRLRTLRLNHNQLSTLPSAIFSNLSNLDRLTLNNNSLTALPAALFSGLTSLTRLELRSNTGAPFTLALALERTDIADLTAPGPAAIVVKVAEGAPFDMSVTLSTTSGTLSSTTATISKGTLRSDPITLTQSGGNSARISMGSAPAVPADYDGIATAVGNPLVLWAAGVCGRTTAVSDAIVSAVDGIAACASITDLHLQLVTGTMDLGNQRLSALLPGDFSGLSSLETLWLYDNALRTLPDAAFASLSNLRFLSLYRNQLTALPDTLFASLDNLKTLHLNDNLLTALPDTAFAGMDSLQTLLMDNNLLTALPDTAFYDLPNLQTLHLNNNRLGALPDSAFKGMDSLQTLRLNDNSLSALPDSAFKGLTHLKILYLNGNSLGALPDSAFKGMDSLQTLHLNDNSLSALPDSAFKGLDNLKTLRLDNNMVNALRDSAFRHLTDLQSLNLASNALSTLPKHAFNGLSDLQSLNLASNALSALPDSLFAGLTSLNRLDLSGNTEARFVLTLSVERTDNASLTASAPATLKVKVAQGAPFEMSVGLSITGGTLSDEKATIAKGSTESAAITVTQMGGSLARVRLGVPPGVPVGYDGIQTAVGDSLVLFGTLANRAPVPVGAIGDVSMGMGGSAVSVNVASNFRDPDGDALTFGATASVQGLASLSATGSVVTITPVAAGIATVTVTATDPDGLTATQTFSLTITNDAPTVAASIADTTALVNTPFTYAFPQNTFSDANGDALTYTSSGLPAWLSFTPATRTFSGTPNNATGSPFAITVEANDGKGGRVQLTFTLSVAAGICTRTTAVRTALLSVIADADTCTVVTDAHLAGVVDSLNLRARRIAALQATDFAGLPNLTTLNLYDNDLTSLPAGVFDDLPRLRFLSLYNNDLTALSASVFDSLSALRFLSLDSNRVTSIPANAFSNLPQLQTLSFSGNGLTALSAGALDSLSNLRELLLDNNALTALPAGALDSLSQLQILGLNGNALSALRTGAFANLSHLRVLNLKNNALTTLPNGVFTGLDSLMLLDLSGNTGANFTLTLALERTDITDLTASGPATIVVKVAEGAPFDMSVTLSVTNGTLTDENAMAVSQVAIPRGSAESAFITATQAGMNQTTITLGTAPTVPAGYRGIAIAVGGSLVLF